MNFYANHNFGRSPNLERRVSGRSPTPRSTGENNSGYELKEDRILNMRVKSLREKYKDDPEILEDLENKIGAFIVNVSIARDLGVKNQEKQLRKEFNNYLNTL